MLNINFLQQFILGSSNIVSRVWYFWCFLSLLPLLTNKHLYMTNPLYVFIHIYTAGYWDWHERTGIIGSFQKDDA